MKKYIYSLVLILTATLSFSQVVTPFSKVYQTTQKGGIVFLANSSLGCSANPPTTGVTTCKNGTNEVPPSGTYSDNSFSSVYIDVDGDGSTFQSSSDSLNLATCSQITKAYLFWGSNGSTATAGYNTVKVKMGTGAYQNVTASYTQGNTAGYNTYHCYADVTSLLQAGGIKTRVTVANIPTGSLGSTNTFGSWCIAVVYSNDLLTMRQLTVFNGLANISGSAPTVNVPINGFLTPQSGPVTFELGVYTHDGDRGSTGDNLNFNGGSGFVAVTDAINPLSDVMNSTVSNNGVLTPFRKPSMNNTGGMDADIFVPNNTTKNYIGNAATTCTFQLTTGGETYLPQMITTAIDVYEPDLRASIKVKDVNGGTANPGDILEYRIKGINIGSDPSVNSFITDTIERNANYIPNSTKIIYGANLGAKTDALSDDQVDYIAASRLLKIRIGAGANAVSGGTVINSPAGIDSTIITYSVTVTNSCTKVACDNVIDARAYILGTGAVSTNTFSNGSNPGIFDGFGCPIPGTTSTPITATACATPTASASSPGVCAGANFTLSTVTDPEVTYLWNGPNSYTSSVQNPVLGPSTSSMTGTYTVTLTAYTGCARTATTTVTINASPSLTATSTSNTLCSSTAATLTASGATTYTWNPGGVGASIVVTPTITTTYTVTGTNASGCTDTKTITLTVNTTPTVNASSSSTAICNGGTATLTATGATTYTWNPGALTGSVVTVSPASTQTYVVTGTTGFCTSTSSVVITVNVVPTLTASASPTAVCAGGVSTLTATGALTYTWNPGNLAGAIVTVTPGSTTNYTVTGTNAVGCTNTKTVSVTFNALPTLTATAGPAAICSGAASTLTGSGAASYTWNPGNLTGATVTVSPASTTNYTLTGTSAAGCSNTQTVTLNVTATPTLNAAANPTAVCSGSTLTLTASGATSYTWNPGGLTGATVTTTLAASVNYTVTGANGSCTSTSIIPVTLNNCPTAVNDATNTIQNTPVTANAGTNDSGTGGGTFTASQPTAGTGTITMSPTTGVYTYTPATGFTGTTSVTYTLCNGSPVICSSAVITVTVFPTLTANPDMVTTTPSVTATGTLTTNDGGIVPGATYSVSVTQPAPATGTITLNPATGQYTFVPNPAYTGSTTTTYTICNTSVNPIVCSNTTVTITVSGAPIAVSNTNTTIQNTPVSGNIGTNDANVNAAQNPTFTVTQPSPATGSITLNPATGAYTFTPNSTFTGTASTTYTVCNLSGLCSNTTITFTVFPTLVANPDVVTTTPITTTTGTLTTNDGGVVPGGTYSVTVTQTPPSIGTITVNPATGQYTFTPNPLYTGSTTTTYTICNTGITPQVCSSTTITITVGNLPLAVADGTTTIINTPVSGNAGTNDSGAGVLNVPNFAAGPVTAGTGTLVMNPTTGAYSYTPATGFTGTTTATYTLCNISSPPCSTTTITFTVFPALVANPDVITTTPGVTATGTLTTNDNGVVPGATYSVSVTQPAPATGTITLNPATGQYTFVPNPSYTGSTTTTYTICNTSVNPIVCSNTTVTITVSGAPIAVSNTNTTIQNTPVSGNIGTNDANVNAAQNPTFTVTQPSPSTGSITLNPATGAYTFTPNSTFTGTASTTYTVCNLSGLCSNTTITFTVFPTLVANPDAATTVPGVTTTGTLTTNDGGVVPGGTYSVTVTQTPPSTGTITVNPTTGQYTFTPNPAYTGSTTTTYTICNTAITPQVCSSTTITITVGNLPLAVADGTTTIINTPVSGNASTNDAGTGAGNSPVFTAGPVTAGTGTLVMNPTTGVYSYTPAAGFTGTTTATYTLCNLSSPPCSTTTITFTVFPALVANPDVITTTPGVTATGTLTTNDGGVVPGGTYSVTVTQTPPSTGTITLNPATGQYTFVPNPSYTGSTTTTYTICNTSVNPIVCSNTTVTITVSGAPIAVSNTNTTIQNTPVSGNIGTNDANVNAAQNPTFTVTQPSPATGSITLNPATGAYTFTPNSTFTGTASTTYTVCNLSGLCSNTTITFTVFPTLAANPDIVTSTPGVTATGTLTTNDGGVVPGGTYSVTVTQTPPSTGTITLNPATGQYTFVPNPGYTGTTSTTYTVCNVAVNPTVCSSTTITIVVSPTVMAVADATTTILNTPVSGNAGTNDVPGVNPVYTGGSVTAGTGTLTINPTTGAYSYTPAPGFTGTTTATYTLCNISSPPCSTTTITFTVFPALVANPDVVTTTPGVTTTGTLTTNDNGVVPGATYSVSVTQPATTTGTITLNPATGEYTFVPNPAYTGTTSTTYTICNTSVNPVVCSNTTVTIVVSPTVMAVADATTTILNTPVSGNAGTNDVPGVNPVYTGGSVTAGTGTLTVNPTTGAYSYTPATGFTGTTTATYTLCNISSPPCSTTTITFTVFPAIVANPDVVNTTPGTATSGTLTTNDGGVVPGGTYSVTVTQTPPSTGTITVDPATGNYTFTPNPAYTGSGTTTYTVCNIAVNPIVCSSTTIAINVFPDPAPVDDYTTTIENTPVISNAGTNDGGTTGGTFSTGPVTAGTGTLTMDPATGSYTFVPSTGFTGVTSATYTLCNGAPVTCSTAVITVTVFPALVANPDVIATTPGTATSGTLTTNDSGVVPGGTYSVTVTQTPPSTGTITVDPATGNYTFTPNPAYTGSATTTYTVCNTAVNPVVCSSTTITVVVGNAPVAVADGTTTIENTPVIGDASNNDSGAIPSLNPVYTGGPVTAGTGTLTMDPATGNYTFTPAAGFTGTTTATYTLCNISSPPCSTTTITFTVFPTLVANPDVVNTTPGTATSGTLTTNDGGIVPGGTYSVTVTQTPPSTGTITVDPATGNYTFTPDPAFTGSATTTYTVCNTAVNPIVCSSTTITIIVGNQPIAVADATTTIENTPVMGDAGTNDTGASPSMNPVYTGGPVTAGTGTLTMDPATGNYTFTPAAGFTGVTSATYTLCNLSSPPCSTTTITFTVFPTLVANPDVVATTPGVTTTGTLTTNDGGIVPGGTYSVTVTQPSPSTGTITVDPATGNYTFTPDPAFTGSTTTTYTVCNTAVNPVVCSSTTITIIVGNQPIAVADATTTIENTPVMGDAGTNDSGGIPSLNPVFTTGPVTAGTGTLTMDPATGQYTFTPAAGFTGTTIATYTLCNISSPPCSTTTITFTVFPTLVANPDVVTTTPGVTVTGTLTTNDGGIVPGATYSVTVTQPSPSTGTITVDPATGNYTFTPNSAFTGSATTTYTVCNLSVNPIVCSNTTITIVVGNQPIAVADTNSTMEGTPVLGNVGTNDGGANPSLNPVFTGGPVTPGTGTLTIDPATGNYTYTPSAGFIGTTIATYTLCNLSSPPCSTTTITFTVFPTLVANPDVVTTTQSVPVSGTLATNDGGVVPGGTYSVTVTQTPPSTGTITVDPATGNYTFTPNPAYTGTTTTTYTICNISVNPVVCSSTTITIIVGNPQVAVSKTVLSTVKTNATTYQSVFSFNVTNLGNAIGSNVQLTDNLNNTFPAPMTYTVVGLNAGAPLTTNAAYDGNTTTAMLAGTNSLNPAQSSIVTLTVSFSPNSTTLTALSNTGIGSTSSLPDPAGTNPHTSVDTTNAGTTPDPDGDGNPNEPGENNPTVFGQQIAAAKTASAFTMINATTFQTVFTFNVANVGPVVATNVQLTDNLNNTFPSPMTYTVVGLNAAAPLTANAGYDGNTNSALLSGSNSMVSGANSVVTLTVNFSTNSSTLSSMSNIGIASTSGSPDPAGSGVHTSVDTTDAGTNPDPDGDGVPNEPGENDPTVFGQQIGGAKTASAFTKLNPTTFQTVFTFNVANFGPMPATNVQLTDNLNNTFPSPMTYTVVGLNANAPLTANAGYNGNTNTAMLSGSNTLNTAQSALVTLTVNFSPNTTALTSLSNIGVVSTSGNPDPTGANPHTSIDTTGAGSNPDPDGDGNPNEPGENNPTFFGEQIGGAKTASALTKINATTYQTVFTFNVANVGPVAASNVQLTDNLNNTFPAPYTYTVVGLTANAPLTGNAGYNGNTDIALLSGSNSLNASQSALVTLTVNFSSNNAVLTSLSNIGIVSTSGTPDPAGTNPHTSIDTTAAGTNPDPDGDGHPNEPGENNPIHFGQQIGVAKAALPSVSLGNGISQTTFVFTVQNLGVLPASNVQLTDDLNAAFPSPITYSVASLTAGSSLTANGSYNGNSVISMLSGNNTLAVGASDTVRLVVNYKMNSSALTSLSNSGVVTTSGPDGVLSSDTTNTGTTVDPDGDGNANEPGENNPTMFAPATDTTTPLDSTLNIPQGFSPNNDGVNDVLIIRGIQNYPGNTVTILNRWGNVVYKVSGYDNTDKVWNGKSSEGVRFGGDDLPEGTYFIILELGNGEKPYKGYIYLNKTIK